MWISFDPTAPFAAHIFVGGVNAISGEPLGEHLKVSSNQRAIQDYVVAPQQMWLDGIASTEGVVRQFVAMPLGSRYSVEAQVSGEESIGGLTFCITPSRGHLIAFKIRMLTGKTYLVHVSEDGYIKDIKYEIQSQDHVLVDQQRLIYCGKELRDDESYGVMLSS